MDFRVTIGKRQRAARPAVPDRQGIDPGLVQGIEDPGAFVPAARIGLFDEDVLGGGLEDLRVFLDLHVGVLPGFAVGAAGHGIAAKRDLPGGQLALIGGTAVDVHLTAHVAEQRAAPNPLFLAFDEGAGAGGALDPVVGGLSDLAADEEIVIVVLVQEPAERQRLEILDTNGPLGMISNANEGGYRQA